MLTQLHIVSDLELRLSKSKPSNDIDITYEQMAYWIDQARDEITKLYIDEAKTVDPSLILELNGLPFYTVGDASFVDLGIIPLDTQKANSIVYVKDNTGKYLFGSSLSNSRYLSKMRFTKPDTCTIVYSLSGSAIQISGEPSLVGKTYSIGVAHSELSRTKGPIDRYYVAPSTLESILESAEKVGLRELNGDSYYDITNDGKGNEIK